MNNHEPDNQILDELYVQTAKELPPLSLDQKILQQAKEASPKRELGALLQWQRYLSVAAVMVLSIYIFFDVGENSMESEIFSAPSENIEADMREEEHATRMKDQSQKAAKSKAKKLKIPEASLSIKEAEASAELSQFGDALDEQGLSVNSEKRQALKQDKPINKTVKPLVIKQGSANQAIISKQSAELGRLMTEPEKMLKQIKHLIALDQLVEAKAVYQTLAESYPEYPVPIEVIEVLK